MKLSVVLCTYNGACFIDEQIRSIIEQTRRVDEIIVSDDGSTDGTITIVENLLKDAGIRYEIVRNESGKGVVNNFLNGLKRITGDYVFTSDQDDIWELDKVEAFEKEIQRTKKMLYFSDGLLVDRNGNSLGVKLWDTLNFDCDHINDKQDEIFDILVKNCIVTGAAMAVSAELVKRVNSVPYGWLHDGWFAMFAACENSIFAINKVTFKYRQHGGNVVGASKKNLKARMNEWVKNFHGLTRLRNDRYERYCAAIEICPQQNKEKLLRCVAFWRDLQKIGTSNRFVGVVIVIKNYFNGNYRKFYTGTVGMIRDFIATLFNIS